MFGITPLFLHFHIFSETLNFKIAFVYSCKFNVFKKQLCITGLFFLFFLDILVKLSNDNTSFNSRSSFILFCQQFIYDDVSLGLCWPIRTTGFDELTRVGVNEVVRMLAAPAFGFVFPK
jgi:hypothetical protein